MDTQYPLISTKLYAPPLRDGLIKRNKLIKQLNDGINHKLTLISAPAGFGKTTILSEWMSQAKMPVAWISLDKGDNDPIQFIHCMVAALQKIEVHIGNAVLSMLNASQQPPMDALINNLIKAISDFPESFALVLDDYHSIDEKGIHSIVDAILDYQPPQAHIIIATRVDPPLHLPRLRVRNQLNELRTADLCFTVDETDLFFKETMNLTLSTSDISALASRTEGWIAGLQLAALSLQGRENIPAFIKTFAGDDRHIVDYLTEEVLSLQSEQFHDFLLQTSILKNLSESLCDFVTGTNDSRRILDDLERANLFIVPLDNKRLWYRYHHLFSDLLKHRLRRKHNALVPELHRRASIWHEKHDMKDEAIEHALVAEDFERAACLIEDYAEALWQNGQHAKLRHWLGVLPDETVVARPQLCICHAYYLNVDTRHRADGHFLQKIEKALALISDNSAANPPGETGRPSTAGEEKLRGRAKVVQALISSSKGDVQGIIRYANQALDHLPKDDATWRSLAAFALGDAYSFAGDMDASYQARAKALRACETTGDVFYIIAANLKLISTLREQGKLPRILEICRQQMQVATEYGFSKSSPVGCMMAIWGETLAEVNDLNGAVSRATKGVAIAEKGGDMMILGHSQLSLMRIFLSMGDLPAAEKIIRKTAENGRNIPLAPWLSNQMANWQAHIWLLRDELDAVAQWAEDRGLDLAGEQQVLHQMDYFALFDYTMLARLLMAQKQMDKALRILKQLYEAANRGGRISSMIKILILQASAFQFSGDKSRAMAALARSITLAEPGGHIRTFVDEGHHVGELIEQLITEKKQVPRAYAKKLLSAFQTGKLIQTEDDIVERLSERELEVMRFIAAGLSNKAITDELFISMSTVKSHLRNIYTKLNVNSRTQAIAKVKELNLL